MMTELEKIAYAKSFIDKLANGINPLDDGPIPEGDIVNNIRLSRCFFYVSDILRRVIENGGTEAARTPRVKKKLFALSEEERARIVFSEKPVTVSEITKQLNGIVDLETTKKISAVAVNQWLMSEGLIESVEQPSGKSHKRPTAAGRELGILTEERVGQYGNYTVMLFDRHAQQFVCDNIEAIMEAKAEQEDPLSEFHGRAWHEDQDRKLKELFEKGLSAAEMAYELKRTEGGIRARLVRLGMIEQRNDIR